MTSVPELPGSVPISQCKISTAAATANTPNAPIINTFVIRKKQYCVRLSDGHLEWHRLKSSESCKTIAVENIIAIEPKVRNSLVPEQQKQSPDQCATANKDAEKPLPVKQFTIFYAKRMVNSSNPNKWRYSTQTFNNSDSQVCQLWIETIQQQINGKRYQIKKKIRLRLNL